MRLVIVTGMSGKRKADSDEAFGRRRILLRG